MWVEIVEEVCLLERKYRVLNEKSVRLGVRDNKATRGQDIDMGKG